MQLGDNPHPDGSAEFFMYEALRLAHRGLGWTSPNPPVGCVLVRDGAIIGSGWHAEPGGLHAETAALASCPDPRGATAYITLEPCSHVGRQPACTSELARAGIARAIYGCEDSDPRSAGQARATLEAHGIQVTAGVLRHECETLLRPYLHAKRTGRPHVHLKAAVSLDGKLACANGASRWLSGPQSHGLAHYLRQQYDAVLVGRGTVEADNPQLTVRADVLREYTDNSGMTLRDPVRVVLDPQFKLLSTLSSMQIVAPGTQRDAWPSFVVIGASDYHASAVVDPTLPLPLCILGVSRLASGALDLAAVSEKLCDLGITSILVEGGAFVHQQYISQRAADCLTLVYTPRLLGSDALDFSPVLRLTEVAAAPQLEQLELQQLGADIAATYRFIT